MDRDTANQPSPEELHNIIRTLENKCVPMTKSVVLTKETIIKEQKKAPTPMQF